MNTLRTLPPSIRALNAFEQVAQLGSVTRAAERMNTSQAAVSRHLRQLEEHLGVQLVVKQGRGVALTNAGKAYAQEVSRSLSILTEAGHVLKSSSQTLTIACTHEVSHLILMPRYAALKKAIGAGVHLQFLTCEYSMIPAMINAGADVIFSYAAAPPASSHALVLREEIIPMVAPGLIRRSSPDAEEKTDDWTKLPRIDLSKDNVGWATWDTWFAARGQSTPDASFHSYDNYVYALDAAIRGEGVVLGWRGFAERYIDTGQLVPLESEWLGLSSGLYAMLTENSAHKPFARRLLTFFEK